MKSLSSSYFNSLLKNDAGFSLLHSRSAHLVLSFLYQVFRVNHIQSINSDEFETRFAVFLQEHLDEEAKLREDEADSEDILSQIKENAELQLRARAYVNSWCNSKEYLRRYYNRDGDAVIELNPSIERLFNWLENCEQKEFVGTESRFQNILLQLRDLHQHINADPESRIAELKKKKAEIDEEIATIRKTGNVQTYTPIQIQERLLEIDRNSRVLLSDFRQVEENFRKIMQGIYKKQSEDNSSRANILGYTLDTDSKLKSSPQGQSFSTFWNFLSQDRENEINTITQDIVSKSTSDNEFLLQLKHYLYDAGHKIIEQNRSLTDRLNRVLKTETAGERKHISNLISSIKKGMNEYTKKVDEGKAKMQGDFMSVETKPFLYFPQARSLQAFSEEKDFSKVQAFDVQTVNPLDFAELFSQFYIDEKKLLQNIQAYKKTHGDGSVSENGTPGGAFQFTLKEFLQDYPLEKGLAELVAFFGLSQSHEKIIINNEECDDIEIKKEAVVYKIRVPRLIFL